MGAHERLARIAGAADSVGAAYQPIAARQAWALTLEFLRS